MNGWPGKDPEAYAEEKSAACEGLVEIEGLPWFERDDPCDEAHPLGCSFPYVTQRKLLLKALSDKGIVTYIVTANSNAYGPWLFSDDAFRAYVQGIKKDVDDLGIQDMVWLGTPSEPWASDFDRGWRRAQIVMEEWPYTLVAPDAGGNHPTGRPYYPTLSYDYLEVHPCSIEQTDHSLNFGTPILTVTDCTPVLNPGPEETGVLFAEAKLKNAPLVIYDAYAQ